MSLLENFRRYSIRQNITWQRKLLNNLIWLESSMALQNPSWSVDYIRLYIISRYADIWQNWVDVRTQYYRLTEQERHQYRLQLITKQNSLPKLCPDVITEIASYL